eukprot:7728563-Pyramimonas_sp.AAC.1
MLDPGGGPKVNRRVARNVPDADRWGAGRGTVRTSQTSEGAGDEQASAASNQFLSKQAMLRATSVNGDLRSSLET